MGSPTTPLLPPDGKTYRFIILDVRRVDALGHREESSARLRSCERPMKRGATSGSETGRREGPRRTKRSAYRIAPIVRTSPSAGAPGEIRVFYVPDRRLFRMSACRHVRTLVV